MRSLGLIVLVGLLAGCQSRQAHLGYWHRPPSPKDHRLAAGAHTVLHFHDANTVSLVISDSERKESYPIRGRYQLHGDRLQVVWHINRETGFDPWDATVTIAADGSHLILEYDGTSNRFDRVSEDPFADFVYVLNSYPPPLEVRQAKQ